MYNSESSVPNLFLNHYLYLLVYPMTFTDLSVLFIILLNFLKFFFSCFVYSNAVVTAKKWTTVGPDRRL